MQLPNNCRAPVTGIELKVEGFSHRLPRLAARLFSALAAADFPKASWGPVKEALERKYRNTGMQVGFSTVLRLWRVCGCHFRSVCCCALGCDSCPSHCAMCSNTSTLSTRPPRNPNRCPSMPTTSACMRCALAPGTGLRCSRTLKQLPSPTSSLSCAPCWPSVFSDMWGRGCLVSAPHYARRESYGRGTALETGRPGPSETPRCGSGHADTTHVVLPTLYCPPPTAAAATWRCLSTAT